MHHEHSRKEISVFVRTLNLQSIIIGLLVVNAFTASGFAQTHPTQTIRPIYSPDSQENEPASNLKELAAPRKDVQTTISMPEKNYDFNHQNIFGISFQSFHHDSLNEKLANEGYPKLYVVQDLFVYSHMSTMHQMWLKKFQLGLTVADVEHRNQRQLISQYADFTAEVGKHIGSWRNIELLVFGGMQVNALTLQLHDRYSGSFTDLLESNRKSVELQHYSLALCFNAHAAYSLNPYIATKGWSTWISVGLRQQLLISQWKLQGEAFIPGGPRSENSGFTFMMGVGYRGDTTTLFN